MTAKRDSCEDAIQKLNKEFMGKMHEIARTVPPDKQMVKISAIHKEYVDRYEKLKKTN